MGTSVISLTARGSDIFMLMSNQINNYDIKVKLNTKKNILFNILESPT